MPCPCGNPTPALGGDDFDADVMCERCRRETPVCHGTGAASQVWNKMVSEHLAGINLFRRPIPPIVEIVEDVLARLKEAHADCQESKEQVFIHALGVAVTALEVGLAAFEKSVEEAP